MQQLEKELAVSAKGVSLEDLQRVCHRRGVHVTTLRTDLHHLRACATPSILHVNENHFVAVLGWEDDRLVLFDNVNGVIECSPEWFFDRYEWDGVVLMYGPPSPMMAASLYAPVLGIVLGAISAYALVCFIRSTRQWKS